MTMETVSAQRYFCDAEGCGATGLVQSEPGEPIETSAPPPGWYRGNAFTDEVTGEWAACQRGHIRSAVLKAVHE